MIKRFWKWIKKEPNNGVIESTKDYIDDENEYINAQNGWEKLPDEFVEIRVKEKEDEKKRKTS